MTGTRQYNAPEAMLEQIGRYRILDRMGSGTLGELFRARDTRVGRTVALRIVASAVAADPDRRRRLIDGGRAAERISHPNVAALYEIGEEAGALYLASEFVPGPTLAAEIAGLPVNWRRAVGIAAQVADALAETHAAGIVHAKVNSASIIITPKGTAKLLDAGLTAWNGTSGSEQGDVVALIHVLVEMLTGRTPATGAPMPAVQPAAVNALVRKYLSTATADDGWISPAVFAAELRAVL